MYSTSVDDGISLLTNHLPCWRKSSVTLISSVTSYSFLYHGEILTTIFHEFVYSLDFKCCCNCRKNLSSMLLPCWYWHSDDVLCGSLFIRSPSKSSWWSWLTWWCKFGLGFIMFFPNYWYLLVFLLPHTFISL